MISNKKNGWKDADSRTELNENKMLTYSSSQTTILPLYFYS